LEVHQVLRLAQAAAVEHQPLEETVADRLAATVALVRHRQSLAVLLLMLAAVAVALQVVLLAQAVLVVVETAFYRQMLAETARPIPAAVVVALQVLLPLQAAPAVPASSFSNTPSPSNLS
jgi:hypothetical protein